VTESCISRKRAFVSADDAGGDVLNSGPNPSGLCLCECGERAPIAKRNTSAGLVKGQPVRYLKGHGRRKKYDAFAPNKVEHRADGVSVLTVEFGSETHFCYVDTVDYPLIEKYRWKTRRLPSSRTLYATAYVGTAGPFVRRTMHKMLLPDVKEIDHEDGNGLNNRRKNLRPASSSENKRNVSKRTYKTRKLTSKYKGVSWARGKWRATAKLNNKQIHLGRFVNEEEAARTYDVFAIKHYGEFALPNFPQHGGTL